MSVGHEPQINIQDTTVKHVRALGVILRGTCPHTAGELPAHHALWRAYRRSLFCKTAFIDGEIAAIWGVATELLSPIGRPWLITSKITEDYPQKVAFRYRRELKAMLQCFSVLEDWVDAGNAKSMRLLTLLGFKFDESTPLRERGGMLIKATMVA